MPVVAALPWLYDGRGGQGETTKAPPFTGSLWASTRSVHFLRNWTPPAYCLSLVLFPVTEFVTVSLLKIPFSSDLLPKQSHPGTIPFCITEKAPRLFDCP